MPTSPRPWATHLPPDGQENQRNLQLWEGMEDDAQALAAWAIFMPHEETFDLFVHPSLHGAPQHEQIMGDYVAWAEARARSAGVKHLSPFWVMEYDTVAAGLLQKQGFARIQAEPRPPLFQRPLDALPAVRLPPGFTVQGVQCREEGRRRAEVTYAAFGVKIGWDAYADNYARFIDSPVYNGAHDLFVRSPTGRGASACTLWLDRMNRVGLFEPVATHPDYQDRGLGKAVMAEGLRRMQAAGMQSAILGFDPNNGAARALYTSMGFQASAYFAIFSKTL